LTTRNAVIGAAIFVTVVVVRIFFPVISPLPFSCFS
jgi:hypothetical protein